MKSKKQQAFNSRYLKSVLVIIYLFFASPDHNVYSQILPTAGHITPGGLLDTLFDKFGHKYALGQLAIDDNVRARYSPPPPVSSLVPVTTPHTVLYTGCTPGYFQIYLEDGCGMDLWATNPIHMARLNVLCRVLTDISDFVHSPLTSAPGTQKVNIWVRELHEGLGVGTAFYNVPYSTTSSGIVDNSVWLTINSGVDAFTNVAPPVYPTGGAGPGSVFFHCTIAFNFSSGYTWHTDLSTPPATIPPTPPSTVPSSEIDLYTVALHEMMHSLGFGSLLDYNGRSVFDQYNVPPTPATYQYYSRYDQHLHDLATGANLISSTSGCSLYQHGFNTTAIPSALSVLSPGGCGGFYTGSETDYTNCTHAIEYQSASGMSVPVYTPECFERGGSLSHFEDECYVPAWFAMGSTAGTATNNQYFLMSNSAPGLALGGYDATTNPGVMKRHPNPEERQVLCDIGYKVATEFGVSGAPVATYPDPSGPNLNYYDFGGTGCNETLVVGIHDGISPTGSYSFHTTGTTPVSINAGTSGGSILDNDRINGVPMSLSPGGTFSCLEVVKGLGTVSTSFGTATTPVTYTPGAGEYGIALLRYIPEHTGIKGNITYIYVFVGSDACSPTTCDLVTNGGFENAPAGSYGYFIPNEACWLPVNFIPMLLATDAPLTPDNWRIPNDYYFQTGVVHPLSPSTNKHFVSLYEGMDNMGGTFYNSSIHQQLATPLVPGDYIISFWALLGGGATTGCCFTNQPTHLQFAAGNSFPLVASMAHVPAGYIPPGFNELTEFNINSVEPDYDWHYYTYTFTYTGPPASTLFIQGTPWHDATPWPIMSGGILPAKSIAIDDISILPIASACPFSIPGPVCSNMGTFDLNTTAAVCIPGGTFSWPTLPVVGGVPTTSTSNIFNPADAYAASIAIGGSGLIPVTYTYVVGGCTRTTVTEIRVNPAPAVPVGPLHVCEGSEVIFSNSSTGGTWGYTNYTGTAIQLFVDVSDDVHMRGVSAGDVGISYTLPGGCTVGVILFVDPAPGPIVGPSSLCVGQTGIFFNPVPGGAWSSSMGHVTFSPPSSGSGLGASAGSDIVSYTLSGGCSSTVPVIVNPSPAVPLGPLHVCEGSEAIFSNSSTGGIWGYTNYTGVAIQLFVDVSDDVHMRGISAGDVGISYTLPGGCSQGVLMIVDPAPGPVVVSGGGTFCDNATLTASGGAGGTIYYQGTTPGGTSTTLGGSPHTVTSSGTYYFRAVSADGCWGPEGHVDVIIVPSPTVYDVTGGGSACAPGPLTYPIYLSGSEVGVIYQVVNVPSGPIVASLPGTGGPLTFLFPGGIAPGNYMIKATNSGCTVDMSGTVSEILNPLPNAYAVTGGGHYCAGGSGVAIGLSGSDVGANYAAYLLPSGGFSSWVAGTGSAISLGMFTTAGIYMVVAVDATTGCTNNMGSVPVIIDPAPDPISTLTDRICVTGTTTYTDATPGGTWSSSNTSVATVDPSTGVVTGAGAGTATISYVLLATGCAATKTIYVSGGVTVCEIAPIATCDNILTYCGSGFTIDVSGAADGSTYTWNPSISGYSSMTCSVTGGIVTCRYVFSSLPATHTYTITSSAGCGSPRVITIVKPAGDCYPCELFRPCGTTGAIPPFKTITASVINSGVISTTVPDNYYVVNDADLVVSPVPGSVFVMGQGVLITIPNTSNVTIDNCHLFSALDECRWQGIRVESDPTASGKLTVSNSLIENASGEGVLVYTGSALCGALPAGGGDILYSDNSIFNNNSKGIRLVMFSTVSAPPFHVEGSIFTARDFCSYSTGSGPTDRYPYVWPTATNLRTPNASPAYGTDHVNDPGFNVDNYPAIGGINKIGIDLMDIGQTVHSTPKVYNCMTIGDASDASNTNMFDTLEQQIRMYGSNIACYNNIFRRPYTLGYGINALPGGASYANHNRTSLQLLGSATSGTNNRFYNCYHAVSCEYIYNIKSEHALITSRNRRVPGGVTNLIAYHGFLLIDSAFDSHEITDNTIRNIFMGLESSVRTDYVHTANGNLTISGNSFEGLTSSTGDEYGGTGITYYSPCSTCTTANGTLSIANNSIFGWVFGIDIQTTNLTTNIDDNEIKILDNSLAQPRFGIGITDASNINQITGNNVHGDVANGVDYNTPLPVSSSSGGINGVRAIYLDGVSNTSSTSTLVSCNSTHDVNIGFKFDDINDLNWQDNNMMRTRVGMLLNHYMVGSVHHTAKIGIQGASGVPSDNTWDDDGAISWPTWTGSASGGSLFGSTTAIYQTFVVGPSNPALSPVYIRTDCSSHNFDPSTGAGASGSASPYTLSAGTLVDAAAGTACTGYTACFSAKPGSGTDMKLSDGTVGYTIMPNPSDGNIIIRSMSVTPGISTIKAKVVDVLGQVIYSSNIDLANGSGNLSVKGVASGMYLLHITDEKGETNTFKLVIQN